MLKYVADNPQVQMAFLLVFAICFIGWMINRRITKAQDYQREEAKEQRRERFIAIQGKKPNPQTIDGE